MGQGELTEQRPQAKGREGTTVLVPSHPLPGFTSRPGVDPSLWSARLSRLAEGSRVCPDLGVHLQTGPD